MLGQAIAFAQFGLFSVVSSNPMLLASFGFTKEQPVLINFILFTYLLGPVDEVRRCAAANTLPVESLNSAQRSRHIPFLAMCS